MRFLGVDPGGKRMGLAFGDDETGIATPFKILEYRGASAAAVILKDIAQAHQATCIVIGLPTAEDGSLTAACARSQALAQALDELGVETSLQSEFLTSNEARRRASDAGLSRSKPVDHFAAQVLLEEFLALRQV